MIKYIPKSVTRFGYRQILKLNKNSPTILVVSGVVGLGATAVLAAKATRKLDPILDDHDKNRNEVKIGVSDGVITSARGQQKALVKVYSHTTVELAKLYAPALVVGTLSAASILHGHRVLQGRHLATMAAYSGLLEQFSAYRTRVSETVGPDMERDIHAGAVGKWEEDPDHKGEHKRVSKFSEVPDSYLRPFFDEARSNWTTDPVSNFLFLKGMQSHMNDLLDIRGHVFLFEVYDNLNIPRVSECIVTGWVKDNPNGDGYIDFGFMTDPSPQAQLFRNHVEPSVRLNFNVDGPIWNLI